MTRPPPCTTGACRQTTRYLAFWGRRRHHRPSPADRRNSLHHGQRRRRAPSRRVTIFAARSIAHQLALPHRHATPLRYAATPAIAEQWLASPRPCLRSFLPNPSSTMATAPLRLRVHHPFHTMQALPWLCQQLPLLLCSRPLRPRRPPQRPPLLLQQPRQQPRLQLRPRSSPPPWHPLIVHPSSLLLRFICLRAAAAILAAPTPLAAPRLLRCRARRRRPPRAPVLPSPGL